jgi:hypothetical protein
MTYEPAVGDVVIALHWMTDRHHAAVVAKVTPKMGGLHYLDKYGTVITSEVHARKRNAIVGKAKDGFTVQEVQNELRIYYDVRIAAEKAAMGAYTTGVSGLIKVA